MSDSKFVAGETANYRGITEKRRGQEVTVVSVGGLIACRFPDGAVIGCAATSLDRL